MSKFPTYWTQRVFLCCVELENHLGISEKTLAEFIIELSNDRRTAKDFGQARSRQAYAVVVRTAAPCSSAAGTDTAPVQQALTENGAQMPESLVSTLWNIIQRLKVRLHLVLARCRAVALLQQGRSHRAVFACSLVEHPA